MRCWATEAFAAQVPLTEPTTPSTLAFHSEDSVHLEPQGTLTTPLGQELLKGKLSFTGNRAVVASFAGVVERQVKEPRQFDKLLWQLFLEQRLAEDEVVVWACRTAATGTVLVNRKGGVEVEVTVDPALVAGVLELAGPRRRGRLRDRLAGVGPVEWGRPGRRGAQQRPERR